MSIKTTVGSLLANQALPEDMRDYSRTWDKKTLNGILTLLAQKHPEKYREASSKLLKLGRDLAYESGGFSFGIQHLKTSEPQKKARKEIEQAIDQILDSNMSPQRKNEEIIKMISSKQESLQKEILKWGLDNKNPLAYQVLSGSRGNPANLKTLIGSDWLYQDHRDQIIPIAISHSYSEGLSPAEYFASTFGGRKGLVDTKLSIADGGFYCLSEGTLVRMADETTKPIQSIQPGEMVLGADVTGKTFPVKVLNRFDNGERVCHLYRFSDEDYDSINEIICTPDHKVLGFDISINRAFVLRVQDAWAILNTKTKSKVFVNSYFYGKLPTYDIEVDHPDHLFVLANGMIVSNSKQLTQTAHRLVVGAQDVDDPDETLGDDPSEVERRKLIHAQRGYPTRTDDTENIGALLSFPAGPYKRNTLITADVLRDLQERGVEKIVVRSPIVGNSRNGGIYARDVGVRERGIIPPVGDMVGMAAAQSAGEKIAQGSLSSKHSGGVVGQAKTVSGFKALNALAQVPKTFPSGAAHAELDGTVEGISEAPSGGTLIRIGGKEHFVPIGVEVKVKEGDAIEAGDILSEGLPNPSKIVEHKGVGEGRRYFVDTYRQALKDSGINVNRRNIELIARGLINHVEFDEESDDYLPGDVTPYDMFESRYIPRPNTTAMSVKKSLNQYLETPVLHYTVGTKVRPSVVKTLSEFGIDRVDVHPDPPPFRPTMIRAMESLTYDPDWMTRMIGSYLQRNTLDAARTGSISDLTGTSYVPGLVSEPFNFGTKKLPSPIKDFTEDDLQKQKRETEKLQKQAEDGPGKLPKSPELSPPKLPSVSPVSKATPPTQPAPLPKPPGAPSTTSNSFLGDFDFESLKPFLEKARPMAAQFLAPAIGQSAGLPGLLAMSDVLGENRWKTLFGKDEYGYSKPDTMMGGLANRFAGPQEPPSQQNPYLPYPPGYKPAAPLTQVNPIPPLNPLIPPNQPSPQPLGNQTLTPQPLGNQTLTPQPLSPQPPRPEQTSQPTTPTAPVTPPSDLEKMTTTVGNLTGSFSQNRVPEADVRPLVSRLSDIIGDENLQKYRTLDENGVYQEFVSLGKQMADPNLSSQEKSDIQSRMLFLGNRANLLRNMRQQGMTPDPSQISPGQEEQSLYKAHKDRYDFARAGLGLGTPAYQKLQQEMIAKNLPFHDMQAVFDYARSKGMQPSVSSADEFNNNYINDILLKGSYGDFNRRRLPQTLQEGVSITSLPSMLGKLVPGDSTYDLPSGLGVMAGVSKFGPNNWLTRNLFSLNNVKPVVGNTLNKLPLLSAGMDLADVLGVWGNRFKREQALDYAKAMSEKDPASLLATAATNPVKNVVAMGATLDDISRLNQDVKETDFRRNEYAMDVKSNSLLKALSGGSNPADINSYRKQMADEISIQLRKNPNLKTGVPQLDAALNEMRSRELLDRVNPFSGAMPGNFSLSPFPNKNQNDLPLPPELIDQFAQWWAQNGSTVQNQ